MKDIAYQQCIIPSCGQTYDIGQKLTKCGECGELLDVIHNWDNRIVPELRFYTNRRGSRHLADISGVWRFREMIALSPENLSTPSTLATLKGFEGSSQRPVQLKNVSDYCDMTDLWLQHEGTNPTGSFKDRGMAVAYTHAKMVNAKATICQSTGNTSASSAAYGRVTGINANVLIGEGKIAEGKLAQALENYARTLQLIDADFDYGMDIVKKISQLKDYYVVNSLNPFRLEGQKTIMYTGMEGLGWQVPDYIAGPLGNGGNWASWGKAFIELKALGLIDKLPKAIIAVAKGARTFSELYNNRELRWNGGNVNDDLISEYKKERDDNGIVAKTSASAIEINDPVNLKKVLRTLEALGGEVVEVSDEEMDDAKAMIGRSGIYACEKASAATVAALKKLRELDKIPKDARTLGILTGHSLKDAEKTKEYHFNKNNKGGRFSNPPIRIEKDLDSVIRALEG